MNNNTNEFFDYFCVRVSRIMVLTRYKYRLNVVTGYFAGIICIEK